MSRSHCIFTFNNDILNITDKSSKFGTLIKVNYPFILNEGIGIDFQAGRTVFQALVKKEIFLNPINMNIKYNQHEETKLTLLSNNIKSLCDQNEGEIISNEDDEEDNYFRKESEHFSGNLIIKTKEKSNIEINDSSSLQNYHNIKHNRNKYSNFIFYHLNNKNRTEAYNPKVIKIDQYKLPRLKGDNTYGMIEDL